MTSQCATAPTRTCWSTSVSPSSVSNMLPLLLFFWLIIKKADAGQTVPSTMYCINIRARVIHLTQDLILSQYFGADSFCIVVLKCHNSSSVTITYCVLLSARRNPGGDHANPALCFWVIPFLQTPYLRNAFREFLQTSQKWVGLKDELTSVHLDSRLNWLGFGGQKSLWPHKHTFLAITQEFIC